MKKKKSLIIIALSIAIIGIVSFNVLAEGKDDGNNKTPLDFCLFASDSIDIQGSLFTLNGGIHSNNKIYIWSSAVSIEGGVWCGTDNITTSIESIRPINKNQPKMKMIQVMDDLESMALINGKIYQGDQVIENMDSSKSAIVKNGGITSSGVVKELNNYLIADKDIIISTNNADSSDKQDTSDRKPIAIASKDGNITINSSYTIIVGTIYAPNGKVTINSSYTYIVGNIIAKDIELKGSNIYMNDKNKIIFDEDL